MRRVKPTPFPVDPFVADSKALGASIRAARCSAGMTLADAALLLGIAKQTLANLETAKSGVSLDTALRAAHEFGVAILAVPGGQRDAVRRALAALAPASGQPGPGPDNGGPPPPGLL